MSEKGSLYLIPTTLGITPVDGSLPSKVIETVSNLEFFIVENIRTSRRYLSKLGMKTPIRELDFQVLNKHSLKNKIDELLSPIDKGYDVGVLSEAGCPGIADPGAEIVAIAHRRNIQVVPLIGPSSILLALMGSGLNGQTFTFHGYLPKDRRLRIAAILELESQTENTGASQVFIEAPFRNKHILQDIVKQCKTQTLLCLGTDLSLESESLQTRTIGEWKKDLPKIDKRPTVFIIGR